MSIHPECYGKVTMTPEDSDRALLKYGMVEREESRWPKGQRCPLCGGATRTPKVERYKVVRVFRDTGVCVPEGCGGPTTSKFCGDVEDRRMQTVLGGPTMINPYNLDEFTTQYIETALWSSLDDDDKPLDDRFYPDDIAQETLTQMVKDCADFQEAHAELIKGNEGRAGHDFWLNRNGYGAGFWDGDWNEPAATILDDASHAYGGVDLYVGDDGKVHGS